MSSFQVAGKYMAVMLTGIFCGSYFIDLSKKQTSTQMSESKYVANQINRETELTDAHIQREVERMLNDTKQRGKTFEMVRIKRPDDMPVEALPPNTLPKDLQ